MRRIIVPLVLLFAPLAARAQDALPDRVPVPADNPMSPGKVTLGQQLYFDPRLSRSGTLSCNTCHNVMAGGDDSRRVSLGHRAQAGQRGAPTVWNAAFQSVQFWDGRAATLEEQAKGPLTNSIEMAMPTHDVVVDVIGRIPGYQSQFREVFGGSRPLIIDNVVRAIAAYERTLITRGSPFDRFQKGDTAALSPLEQQGLQTFRTAGCVACHSGVNLSGPSLPIGTGFYMKFPTYPDAALEKKYGFSADLGRQAATKQPADAHLWRVPTLRNIALTAPYFHNGAVATLDEAVRVMGKLQLGRDLKPAEIQQIVAFLGSLTGEFPAQTMPRLPETRGVSLIGVD